MSDLVREFLAREPQASSYEIAARLGAIGCDPTGPADAVANAKKYLERAIRAKHRR